MESGLIDVDLENTATDREVELVRESFADAGIPATVTASVMRKSATLPPWVIYISLPVGMTIGVFFQGFVNAAGADAWRGLSKLIGRLFAARKDSEAPKGGVLLQLSEEREEIVFTDGLPDRAYRELINTTIVQTESGQLQWDERTQQWRDSLDMARDHERSSRSSGS